MSNRDYMDENYAAVRAALNLKPPDQLTLGDFQFEIQNNAKDSKGINPGF
jgi:hypothetical protein